MKPKKLLILLYPIILYMLFSYWTCIDIKPGTGQNKHIELETITQGADPWACGHACLAMIAHYLDPTNRDAQEFYRLLRDEYPYHMNNTILCNAGNNYLGSFATFSTYSTYDLSENGYVKFVGCIIGNILNNAPPIVFVKAGYGLNNHGVVAHGANNYTYNNGVPEAETIEFNDPGNVSDEFPYGHRKKTFLRFKADWLEPFANQYGALVTVYYIKKGTSMNFDEIYEGCKEFLRYNGTYYGGPASYIPVGSEFVRISFPIGTDELHLEDIEHIEWESNGLSGNIKLELLKGDTYWGTIATNLPIQQGDYRWKVGQCQNDWATMGDNYKIKITMMDGSDYDTSNVDFSIIEPLITYAITATAGAGGTIDPAGTVTVTQGADKTFNITANSCYIIQNVTADGFSKGAISSYKFVNVQANHSIAATFAPAPTYTITATAGSGGTITPYGSVIVCQRESQTFQMIPNSGYAVQSVTVDGVSQGAITSYTFPNVQTNHTIAVTFAQIGVFLLTPNGGENWEFNTYKNITWSAPGITGNVQLSLFRNGKSVGWIANCPAAQGTYSWKVGTYEDPAQITPAGNGYTIKINSWDGTYVDTSNAPFSIYRSSGSLTLTAPNGGENWQFNTYKNITWSSPGVTGNVALTLYRNGSRVGWIANCPASQGSYSWKTGTYEDPRIQVPVGSGYAIEIKSMDGSYIDESNATFNIVNPSVYITLTAPNGGESWHFNTSHNITWNSQGISGNVQIVLYRNGAKVAWLANWAAYKGTYDWRVGFDDEDLDLDLPVGGGYSILIKSGDGVYTDTSDGTFTLY